MIRQIRALVFTFCLLTETVLGQGSVLLVGGGENYNDCSDAPYHWLVAHAPNRKVAGSTTTA